MTQEHMSNSPLEIPPPFEAAELALDDLNVENDYIQSLPLSQYNDLLGEFMEPFPRGPLPQFEPEIWDLGNLNTAAMNIPQASMDIPQASTDIPQAASFANQSPTCSECGKSFPTARDLK